MPLYKFRFASLSRELVDTYNDDDHAQYVARYVAQQTGCECRLSRKVSGKRNRWRDVGTAVPDPDVPMGWAVRKRGS